MDFDMLRKGAKITKLEYLPCETISTFQSLDAIVDYLKESEDNLYNIDAYVLYIGKTKRFLDITDFSGKRYAIYPGAWFIITIIDCASPWNKDVLPPYTEEISIEDVFGEKLEKWTTAKRSSLIADSESVQLYKYKGLDKLIKDKRKLEQRTVSIVAPTFSIQQSFNPS